MVLISPKQKFYNILKNCHIISTHKKINNKKTQVLYSNTSSKKTNIKIEKHQNLLFFVREASKILSPPP